VPDERRWIRDLSPGTDVDETYVVRSLDVRQRRGGGNYLALTLADRTGTVAGLVWEDVERLAKILKPGTVARVRGQVQRYNQRLQVVVRSAQAVPSDQVDETVFVRSSSVDPGRLWSRLLELVESVEDERLKQLLFRVFADPEVEERFRVAPAARSMHHAYRSGLLEHTVSMTTAAATLAVHYGLDRSLVVAGALLHDLGKIWELEIGAGIEYTDDGRLLGHLPLEVLWVDRRISEM